MDDLNANTDDNTQSTAPPIEEAPPDSGQQPEAPTGGEEAGKTAESPPETYALDLGEWGANLPPEELQFFGDIAKESGASPEVASALMQRLGIYNQAVQDFTSKEWEEAARNDQEYGGAQFEQNIAIAKQALEQFGSPALSEMLAHSPMGNHPEVIRFLINVGKAVSEDNFVTGTARNGGVKTDADLAQALYS